MSKNKKMTIEDIKKYVSENTTAKVLSDSYTNNKAKLHFECECGETFERVWSKFKNANQHFCKKCALKKLGLKKSLSKEEILPLFANTKSELLDVIYGGGKTKIKIKCECGEIYIQTIDSLRKSNNKICKSCSDKLNGLQKRLSLDLVDKELKSFNVKRLSEYKDVDSDMKLECSCGDIFYSSLYKLRVADNKVCKKCLSQIKFNDFNFDEDNFKKRLQKDVTLLSEYKGLTRKVKVMFNKCGHIEERVANYFLKNPNGAKCKKCNISNGEKKIENYLINNNIKFIPQHRISECKNIRPLPFDFFLPEYNILIEFQGEGHFENQRLSKMKGAHGGFSEFLKTKKNDLLKKKFCREHKEYKLIEIMYYEFGQIHNIIKYSLRDSLIL